MEITVTIPDEVADQAKALGLSPESYVEGLVESGRLSASATSTVLLSTDQRLTKIRMFIEELSANSENIPLYSDEIYTRDSFYRDHD